MSKDGTTKPASTHRFDHINRRDIIKLAGTGMLGSALFLTAGCEKLFSSIKNRPVRRDIATLDPNGETIQTFRDGIEAIKSLKQYKDSRSISSMTSNHQFKCPHGNWFFLPWHRGLLYSLETIIRDLTGNNNFGLPYWNWNQNRSIPDIFWGDETNPLWINGRVATPSTEVARHFVSDSVMKSIFSSANFELFGSFSIPEGQPAPSSTGAFGLLENTPHNQIHNIVGGYMGGFASPRDPIFWTHHCMVDAVWTEWTLRGGRAPSESHWLDYAFEFVNVEGNYEGVTARETLIMPYLYYQYDNGLRLRPHLDYPDGALEDILRKTSPGILAFEEKIPIRVPRPIEVGSEHLLETEQRVGPLMQRLEASVASDTSQQQGSPRLIVFFNGITPPITGEFYVRIFINHPSDANFEPDGNAFYAGSFAFFVDPESVHRHHKQSHVVDVTDVLDRLLKNGQILADEPLTLSIYPVPYNEKQNTDKLFRIEAIEIAIARP